MTINVALVTSEAIVLGCIASRSSAPHRIRKIYGDGEGFADRTDISWARQANGVERASAWKLAE
jgi:hypothetical protein